MPGDLWSDISGGENPRYRAWVNSPEVRAYTKEQVRLSKEGFRPGAKVSPPPSKATRAEADAFLSGFRQLGTPPKPKTASRRWDGPQVEPAQAPPRTKSKAPAATTSKPKAQPVQRPAATAKPTVKGAATASGWRPLSPTVESTREAADALLKSLGL